MYKLFLGLLLCFITGNAQTSGTRILFEDSFEAYPDFAIDNVGDWIMLDLDKEYPMVVGEWDNNTEPQAFIIFNTSVAGQNNIYMALSSNFKPRTGRKFAGCWRNKNKEVNNDWLISPPIQLGAVSNELRFWVRDFSFLAGFEDYEVGIYSGTDNPVASSDFGIVEARPKDYGWAGLFEWKEKEYDLDAYAGQTVRIGIHYFSKNKYFMMVDDFKVTTAATMGTRDFFDDNFCVYPNPVKEILHVETKNNTKIKAITITDINGKVVQKEYPMSEKIPITVAGLTAGTYFISVQTHEGTVTSRFLKK